MAKRDKEKKKVYSTINVYPESKERFDTKFKQYQETDDAALNRLLDSAGVQK